MSKPARAVLVAPNAFKGCLTALEAARAMAAGVRRARAKPTLLPIADGGDGLIESVLHALGGKLVQVRVTGPLGERRTAAFGLAGRTAIIEMARASGLALLPKGRFDPLGATSRGVGELIRAALAKGADHIVVGLGGSATNDGGAGMAQALGVKLLDDRRRELLPGAGPLEYLDKVDPSGLDPRARKAKFTAVSDVTNPLLGPEGSARVYGPQKGATPTQVAALEKALARWAMVLKVDARVDVANVPGAGAAGGLGSGLLAVLKAELVPGAAWVLQRIGAEAKVKRASLVLTGEGSFDRQSFMGKAPAEMARLAMRLGRPAALVCGKLEPGVERRLAGIGVHKAVSISARVGVDKALRETKGLLEKAAFDLVSDWSFS